MKSNHTLRGPIWKFNIVSLDEIDYGPSIPKIIRGKTFEEALTNCFPKNYLYINQIQKRTRESFPYFYDIGFQFPNGTNTLVTIFLFEVK